MTGKICLFKFLINFGQQSLESVGLFVASVSTLK